MRRFYIENTVGIRQDLNGIGSGIYFTEPQGLGYELADEFAALGQGFFKNISFSPEVQKNVAGKLVFTKNAYATYKQFVDWLSSTQSLRLVYQPLATEYYRNVEVTSISKTELVGNRWLSCEISFKPLTPWYLPTALRISMATESTTSGRFTASKFDVARFAPSRAGSMAADIDPSGHFPAAILFRYTGAAEDPAVILSGASGEVYGKCQVYETFAVNDILEICSAVDNSYVRKIHANGTMKDLINNIEKSFNPFPRVPLSEPCTLRIISDAALPGYAEAQVFYYYRTV